MVALAAYAMVAAGSLRCLHLRVFKTLPATASVWPAYYSETPENVNNLVAVALGKAETWNAKHLGDKSMSLRIAFAALAAETAILAIAAAVSG